MNNSRDRQCKGKVGHHSKFAACQAVAAMSRQGEASLLEAYHCRFCRRWHVGHVSKKRQPGKRLNYMIDLIDRANRPSQ